MCGSQTCSSRTWKQEFDERLNSPPGARPWILHGPATALFREEEPGVTWNTFDNPKRGSPERPGSHAAETLWWLTRRNGPHAERSRKRQRGAAEGDSPARVERSTANAVWRSRHRPCRPDEDHDGHVASRPQTLGASRRDAPRGPTSSRTRPTGWDRGDARKRWRWKGRGGLAPRNRPDAQANAQPDPRRRWSHAAGRRPSGRRTQTWPGDHEGLGRRSGGADDASSGMGAPIPVNARPAMQCANL